LQRLFETYQDTAEFLLIYIREAHPDSVLHAVIDGERVLRKFAQTDTLQQRCAMAQICRATLGISLPTLVDKADNKVNVAYAAWPERLVIVGVDGKIAYPGKPGPWGFKIAEVQQWLEDYRQ